MNFYTKFLEEIPRKTVSKNSYSLGPLSLSIDNAMLSVFNIAISAELLVGIGASLYKHCIDKN